MDYILVDKEGKKQFYEKFEEVRDLRASVANELSRSYDEYVGDGWHDNPAYEAAMRKNRMIDEEINKYLNHEKRLKVVEDKYDEKLVNINDVLNIEFIYSEDDKEIEKLKLTGKYIPDIDLNIKEISLNSPLGREIYKKEIGKEYKYIANDKEITIRIVSRDE